MFIKFATETDNYRVMSGKLWLFDGNLFALKDLDRQSQLAKTSLNPRAFGSRAPRTSNQIYGLILWEPYW